MRRVVKPQGEAKDDWVIIQKLAEAMGTFWNYRSWEDIISEINLVIPQYGGITPERLKNGESLQWPCPNSKHPGTPVLHKEKFTRGMGLILPVGHIPPVERICAQYPFVMSTGRNLYHYHTGSMTRRSKTLNSFSKEPYLEMNTEDMKELNIADNERVKVFSRRGEILTQVKSSDRVQSKNIFVPFHFAEAAANRLTINALDPKSKMAELKVCAVSITKI